MSDAAEEPRLGPAFRQTRREMWLVLGTWAAFAVWVLGSAAVLGYGREPDEPLKMILGMPAWVFWCVALPWAVCTVVTVVISLHGIKDEGFPEDEPEAGGMTEETGKG